MASYLRPRRGTHSKAYSSGITLKKGELFLEFDDTLGIGGGPGKIMVGDGTTAYADQVDQGMYFFDPDAIKFDGDSAVIGWTDSTGTAGNGHTNKDDLNALVPSANLKTILGLVKKILFNLDGATTTNKSDITSLNTKVTTNASGITTLNNNVSTLNTKVDKQETSISNLNTTVTELSDEATNSEYSLNGDTLTITDAKKKMSFDSSTSTLNITVK